MSERWNADQAVDPRPGPYYVSATNGEHYWLMRGPFAQHADALDAVRATKDKACELDHRAHWMAWGTSRAATDRGPGKLNHQFEKEAV